jgi:uncharacterized protein YeaO (DUF488 family)
MSCGPPVFSVSVGQVGENVTMRGIDLLRLSSGTLKRVYEPSSPEDGVRIPVDRLWPRGLAKADAAADCWLKEIAPSTELRQWFDPVRWPEFRRRCAVALHQRAAVVNEIRQMAKR